MDAAAGDRGYLGHLPQRRDHGRLVDILGGVPGLAVFLGLVLQVAAGHVEAGCAAIDMGQRISLGDIRAATLQRKDQFHLVMIVFRARRIGDLALGHDQRGRRFGEIERCLPVDNGAHLGGMCLIIAADAENPVHRIELVAADDRNGGRGGRFEQIVGHGLVLVAG